jgi:hypothetical protein
LRSNYTHEHLTVKLPCTIGCPHVVVDPTLKSGAYSQKTVGLPVTVKEILCGPLNGKCGVIGLTFNPAGSPLTKTDLAHLSILPPTELISPNLLTPLPTDNIILPHD